MGDSLVRACGPVLLRWRETPCEWLPLRLSPLMRSPPAFPPRLCGDRFPFDRLVVGDLAFQMPPETLWEGFRTTFFVVRIERSHKKVDAFQPCRRFRPANERLCGTAEAVPPLGPFFDVGFAVKFLVESFEFLHVLKW